jgi:hypothetical protein
VTIAAGQETYATIIAGVAMVVVLLIAGRLRHSISADRERQRRRERYVRGPALSKTRYRL